MPIRGVKLGKDIQVPCGCPVCRPRCRHTVFFPESFNPQPWEAMCQDCDERRHYRVNGQQFIATIEEERVAFEENVTR